MTTQAHVVEQKIGETVFKLSPIKMGTIRKNGLMKEFGITSTIKMDEMPTDEQMEAMIKIASVASDNPEGFIAAVDDLEFSEALIVVGLVFTRLMNRSGMTPTDGVPKGEAQGSQNLISPDSTGSSSQQPAGHTEIPTTS
jgi:hypothetical protein